MIARTWRGSTRVEDAEDYLRYLRETGFREYEATPGNRGTLGLRRIVGDRAELLLVTLWADEDSIHGFAGDEIERAVFYPEDDRFLLDREERVTHFEVVHLDGADREDHRVVFGRRP